MQRTNADTYISGPFNFAIVNNRKSRDRASIENWEKLSSTTTCLQIQNPSLFLTTQSIAANFIPSLSLQKLRRK